MKPHNLLKGICLLATVTCATGYGSGAPEFACSDMTPQHGPSPQTSASPFSVTFNPTTFTPGGSPVTVTLSASSGRMFKGFLLTRASTTNAATKPGTFALDATGNSRVACSNMDVTHNNKSGKTSLQFQWTPPATSQGHVQFRATFVESSPVFWVGVPANSLLLDSTLPAPTGTTQAPTPTPAPTGRLTKDSECGSTKGCYSQCSGTDCDFSMTWEQGTSPANVRITISGLVGGSQNTYLALGLSKDDQMGDDSVSYCVKEGAYSAYNVDGNKRAEVLTNSQDGLSDIQANLTNGVLTCSFLRDVAAGSDARRFALDPTYTLFFATGGGAPTFLGKHNQAPVVSTAAASLQDFTADVSGSARADTLVKIHGSLMVIAWIFAASIGTVMARYFKNVWEDSKWCGEKVWFQIHRTCMITALLATVVAFILIFIDVGGYSQIDGEGYKKAHPIIGITVTILTVINPTIALFRPHPGTKNRPIFNWVHWGIGTAAYILGVTAIFFGMKLGRAHAPDYVIYILAAFVGWQFLVQVLLEVAHCMGRNAGRSNMYEMTDPSGEPSKHTQASESTFHKQLIIFLHMMVVTGFAIAIIVVLNVGSHDHDHD